MNIESRLSLQQLRAFAAVYRLKRVTDAAAHLSLTPSAVSLMIRQTESALGVALFDRAARTLNPTLVAHEAIVRVERILFEVGTLGTSLRGLRDLQRGLVHLAAPPTVGAVLLPQTVRRFRGEYPHVQVRLTDCEPNQFVHRIQTEQVEFGIGTPEGDAVGLEVQPLLEDALSIVCPADHPFAKLRQVKWSMLKDQPVIVGMPGYGLRRLADSTVARIGFSLHVANEVNFLTSAVWMVGAGLGLAIFPERLVDIHKHPELIQRRLVAPLVRRSISLVTKQGRSLSPASARFIEMLTEQFRSTGGRKLDVLPL